jgi:hypothetical protein
MRMDWLTLFSSLVSSLAWPVTAIVAFYVFKNNVGALSPFVARLKFKGLEVEFRKGIEKAAEESKTALPDGKNGQGT